MLFLFFTLRILELFADESLSLESSCFVSLIKYFLDKGFNWPLLLYLCIF